MMIQRIVFGNSKKSHPAQQIRVQKERDGDSAKQTVIGAFADLAVHGGFVSFSALRSYLDSFVTTSLSQLVAGLKAEGLVELAYDVEYGAGIKLTAKGAVRLWFWNWPEEVAAQ